MNKEEIEDDRAIKISMPLLTEREMLEINNNFNEIVNENKNQFIKEKDLTITQYTIDKQQKELKQKESILDKVTDSLDKLDKILKQDGIFGYDVEIRKILDIIEGEKK